MLSKLGGTWHFFSGPANLHEYVLMFLESSSIPVLVNFVVGSWGALCVDLGDWSLPKNPIILVSFPSLDGLYHPHHGICFRLSPGGSSYLHWAEGVSIWACWWSFATAWHWRERCRRERGSTKTKAWRDVEKLKYCRIQFWNTHTLLHILGTSHTLDLGKIWNLHQRCFQVTWIGQQMISLVLF